MNLVIVDICSKKAIVVLTTPFVAKLEKEYSTICEISFFFEIASTEVV